MNLVQLHLTLLIVAFLFLGGRCGNSSHSLTLLYTLTAEPVLGLPQFVAKAYLDDQLIGFFDSNSKKAYPAVSWMEKVEKGDPNFWRWVTQRAVNSERSFRDDLKVLQRYYNQSEEFHTWQSRHGCEVDEHGCRGGYFQYAYNGKEIIRLDLENFTCIVTDAKAEVLKRRWEKDPAVMMSWKGFLKEECPAWLLEFVAYGNETLMRREAPVAKVTLRTLGEKQESLICEVHGFYPREMEATWRRDGEVWEHRTSRRSITPNSDGTYYAWLSIDIDPTERSHFKCHVDHPSLAEPLVLAWKEPDSHRLRGIWVIALFLLLAFALASWLTLRGQKHFWSQAGPSNSRTHSNRRGEGVFLCFRGPEVQLELLEPGCSPAEVLRSQWLTPHVAEKAGRAKYYKVTVSDSQQFSDFSSVPKCKSAPLIEQQMFSPATTVRRRSRSW